MKIEFIGTEFILNFLCRMFSIEICIAQLPPVNLITFNTRWSQKISTKRASIEVQARSHQ